MRVTILKEHEIRDCVQLDLEVIGVIEDAFASLARGEAVVPPILALEIPEFRGETDVKTAYIRGLDIFGIKVASGFFDNPELGLPSVSGLILVLDSETGFLRAILLDNGYLTNVRTGAAGGVAGRHLAANEVETAGVIGAGAQARYQMIALKQVRAFKRLLVYSIAPEEIPTYIEEMGPELGVEIEAATSVEEVVRESDVVVTTTPAREPYLKADWLHPGLHITAMGADMEGKQELFPDVLRKADVLACDQKSQCLRLGELHHGVEQGVISADANIQELGEIITGRRQGRLDQDQVTVCDLVGIGVQDTAISRLTYRRAIDRGYGTEIEI